MSTQTCNALLPYVQTDCRLMFATNTIYKIDVCPDLLSKHTNNDSSLLHNALPTRDIYFC